MARQRFQLTEDQVRELTYAYGSCKDGPTRTRYQTVRLYGTGYPTKEVTQITGCSRITLMEWCRKYNTEGVAGLSDRRVGGNAARLTHSQIYELREKLHTYTPTQLFGDTAATTDGQFWTVPDLRRAIEQWYGVSYQSPSSYLRYFDICDFSYQRPDKVYKSRSEAKVAEFEAALEKN
ncbi:MAG: helix-turn-helix domain-containing protein [Gaiellaceae bacterium]